MGILLTLIVYLAILAIIYWVITSLPLPEPFGIVAKVVFAIVAIIMLVSLVGGGFGTIGPVGCNNGFHLFR